MNTHAPVSVSELDAYYDERYRGDYMVGHDSLEAWRVADVLRSIALPKRPAVVDYGCGRGAWVPLLREVFPDAQVVGVEISPTAVEQARGLHPDCEFSAFDGTSAPLPDGSSDLVFSYHVLEHVLDLDETVADMARLARPGGYVCAILPSGNPASIEELTTRLVADGVGRSVTGESRFFFEDPGHLRRLTSEQLAERFAAHGCELVGEFHTRRLAALQYISSSPPFIRELFAPRRGSNPAAAGALALLHLSFMSAAALVRARQVGGRRLFRQLGGGPGPARRLAAAGGLLAAPLAIPLARGLEALARREWRRTSGRRRGAAAQFLVFRKD